LNEAATNFPNNPQVELAVLAHDEFPQDRRKWLDLFKNSSPSNSLANYLSAQDDFKNGNSDAAIQELSAATSKSQFDNYETESRLNEEDLFSFSGRSSVEASIESLTGISSDVIPELATLKHLDVAVADFQKQQLAAGNSGSAENLAQMGMALGDQLSSGDSGKYIMNQLVGIAGKNVVLGQLDPNTAYDFLNDETPSQALQELEQQKKSIDQLVQNFNADQSDMNESVIIGFEERMKIYGEIDAMKWAIQQRPPPASQSGQQ
jgi:hypothetical protein